MTDRDRARQILSDCRDILMQRLVERVLEYDDALLDDARGDSYGGEIDSLQEQVGTRLQAVNQLMSLLPLDEPAVYSTDTAPPLPSRPDPLPALEFSSIDPVASEDSASFQTFVRYVLGDDLDDATTVLQSLLGLPRERAAECSLRFAEQVRGQPGFLSRAMALRSELSSDSTTAVQFLSECFGLDGAESASAWKRLSEQR